MHPDPQQLHSSHGFRVCMRIANSGQPCSAEFAGRSDLTSIGSGEEGYERDRRRRKMIGPTYYQIFHHGLEAWRPGRDAGVGRGLAVAVGLGANVGVGVGVTVDVAVGVGDGG